MNKAKCLALSLALVLGVVGLVAQPIEFERAVGAGGAYSGYGRSIAVDNQGNQFVTGGFWGNAEFGEYDLGSSDSGGIFVAKLDPLGNWLWAVQSSGTGNVEAWGIDVDSAGYSYITGSFSGTATFGPYTLNPFLGPDIFCAKLDPNGSFLWAVRAGGTGVDEARDIAVDDLGNIYLTGMFRTVAAFGSISLTETGYTSGSGTGDIFVAKLDPAGSFLWAVRAGGQSEDVGRAISVDSAGNAYITGFIGGGALFGGHSLYNNSGNQEVCVAKLNPTGGFIWAQKAGGSESDWGRGIATDNTGNTWVTGFFDSDVATFGPFTLTAIGTRDIFVAKLDSTGNWLWAVRAGGTEHQWGNSIAVDNLGNAYLTGYFRTSASFGSLSITANGWDDIFAAKIDPDGNWLWAVNAGGGSGDEGFGIDVDGDGIVYLIGSFFSSIATFGTHTLINSGSGSDFFVAKLSRPLQAGFETENFYGTEPLTVQFTDQSIIGVYPITDWLWDFGDGGSSTLQNPVHIYLIPGVFTVTLTVTNPYQTSTLVRSDYITVIERVYAIDLLTQASHNFGVVYLEEQSAWQPIVLSNTGNVDITLSAVYFANGGANYELSEPFSGLDLSPEDQATLNVRFAPHQVGTVSDTLVIVNNSANQPLVKIRLTGTGEYVPLQIPQNMVITMAGNDVHLAWDAVTLNLHDQPVTPDYYLVFSSAAPYATFVYHGATTGLQYSFPMAGLLQPRMFYRVVAYKYYGRGVLDPGALGLVPGMREEEVLRLLP